MDSEVKRLSEGLCEFADNIELEDEARLDMRVREESAGVSGSIEVAIAGEETELVEERMLFAPYLVDDGTNNVDVIMGTGCPLSPMVKVGRPVNS